MNRGLVLLALFGLGSIAALIAGADPVPQETVRWEYGVYRALGQNFQWQTKDTDIYGRGLQEFFKKLDIKSNMSIEAAETVLINHFGEQGWELIEMSPPSGTSGTWAFWFKRPVR